ncbi:MAG: Rpn family recombination-promoting nuclease/putative transposase [Bacteroidales bacterium]|nr:Rpn family recombination-promoting nuclease/putative transposase [Bacteroidales bacterium]
METPSQSQPQSRPAARHYANVLLDYWFKRTFYGNENRKRLLILFLNELIPEREIVDLAYSAQEGLNPDEDDKGIRVDVECTDSEGRRFVVEMQRAEQLDFFDRAVFYSTFAVQKQLATGVQNYTFKTVYFIGILEKFGWALHNLSLLDRKPDGLKEEIFQLLFESADIATFTPEERIRYENDMTTERDIRNQIAFAKQKGLKEGERNRSIAIARQMLADGISEETVKKYTGFSGKDLSNL